MEAFFDWFFTFIVQMFTSAWNGIAGIFIGIYNVFNIPKYISLIGTYKSNFNIIDWIFAILAFIIVYAFWAVLILIIVMLIRKYIRFRKTLVGNEDLLEEISLLHREIDRAQKEKERLLALKLGAAGMSLEELQKAIEDVDKDEDEEQDAKGNAAVAGNVDGAVDTSKPRFSRLDLVDEKYTYYTAPNYVTGMNLQEICEDLRNFACYRSKLYYDIKTIRLMIAGLATSKMVILQGISGTGKTSLPYIMGKYFSKDVTIASVQPSWRDRAELFGFFNEFTKKFNETEVLRRIYDSSFNDDVNIIILDEMNIARVEYYFAEMLSIMEMPDPNEWKVEIVPSSWESDPDRIVDGKLFIPQNVWYVGTANNDDSTFAISDKVYDRAFTINLDSKGVPFDPEPTEAKCIPYTYVDSLYKEAVQNIPFPEELMAKLNDLDSYVIQHFRIAFGNRIMKQIQILIPVYIACGGTAEEALDYILASKVLRKFETLNLGLIRDELKGFINYLDNTFGKDVMSECIAYLRRLQKMY